MDAGNDTLALEIMVRWVQNCFDHLLSDLEISVLKQRLNFVVTPLRVPVVDIVTAMESACMFLVSGDVHDLSATVVQLTR